MNHQRLLNALVKSGHEIKRNESLNVNGEIQTSSYYCIGKRYVCSWYKQEERAICVHIRPKDEERRIEIDYFPGFYVKTIKEAVEYAGRGN